MTQSLSQRECDEHRARIAIEVEIVLDGYWQKQPSEKMRIAILADWMDALEDWHVDQVREALRSWRSEFPSKKPNPGHIEKILKERRGRVHAFGDDKDPIFAINRGPLRIADSG